MKMPKNQSQKNIANKNLKLYVFIKIFAKRVFLPLSAIYFVDEFGFSVKEIGLLAVVFAITQIIAEMPTGYFADRIARVTSIKIGALLNVAATLLYVLSHAKAGIYIGQFMEALGYSFMAGAGEALVHDSLVVTNNVSKYSKILSRAQSTSLLINAALVALIPITYRINTKLPFLIGSLAYLSLFIFAMFMKDVQRPKHRDKRPKANITRLLGQKTLVVFAILFGIVGALYTAPSDIINLSFRAFGMKPEFIGIVYAAASLFGAFLGLFVHKLKRINIKTYLMIDCAVLISIFIAGLTGNIIVLGFALINVMAFWRYRQIIYQDHLLTLYPSKYKATLLSAMNNIQQVNLLWMPAVIAIIVAHFGYSHGLGIIGLFTACVSPFYIYFGNRLMLQHISTT